MKKCEYPTREDPIKEVIEIKEEVVKEEMVQEVFIEKDQTKKTGLYICKLYLII